jgi:uncharacterized membrane protein
MIKWVYAYGAAAVTFVALDGAWLALVGPKLYKPVIGEILADQVRLWPAVIFYVLYIAGVVVLAIRSAGGWREAALLGAALGLVAYGTYALTDQAILKVWATKLTVLDMAWGAFATAAAATAGYWASRHAFGGAN